MLQLPQAPSIPPNSTLTPDAEAGDDFIATGPGPKRQKGGTVPGCEVAGWGLT